MANTINICDQQTCETPNITDIYDTNVIFSQMLTWGLLYDKYNDMTQTMNTLCVDGGDHVFGVLGAPGKLNILRGSSCVGALGGGNIAGIVIIMLLTMRSIMTTMIMIMMTLSMVMMVIITWWAFLGDLGALDNEERFCVW